MNLRWTNETTAVIGLNWLEDSDNIAALMRRAGQRFITELRARGLEPDAPVDIMVLYNVWMPDGAGELYFMDAIRIAARHVRRRIPRQHRGVW